MAALITTNAAALAALVDKATGEELSAAEYTALKDALQEANVQTHAANTVLAGPTSGAAAAMSSRALVAADIPTGIAVNKLTAQTASRLAVYDASGFLAASAVTATEAGYLSGATSAIQTQIDGKAASAHTHVAVDVTDLDAAVNAILASYYTSAQVDSIISGLSNTYYTEGEVDSLVGARALAARLISTGAGLSGGGDLSADRTLALALSTLVANQTLWDGSQATRTLTFGLSGATDPVLTLGNNSFDVSTGVLKQGGVAVLLADAIGATVQAQLGFTPENAAAKGAASGYAPLGGDSKVPVAYLPDTVLGAVDFQGTWNATTNSPDLGALTPTKGDYYVVSVSGSTSLGGITSWVQGDWAIYNGTAWEKVDNTDAVASVAGKTGAVTLDHNDVTDWAEAVDDRVAALLVEGPNITLTYDDVANTLTVEASASAGMTDPMTTRGDIIVRNASNVTARKALGAAATYLRSDGDDPLWAVLSASDLAAGTIPDARFPATLPAASGVNLTALNATQLTSGTVPDARFPATLPALSGANLTALNASNVSSGSLALARITALTANRVVYADGSGLLAAHANVTDTELGYLDGVTSAIQTQLDARLTKSGQQFPTLWPSGGIQPGTAYATFDTRLGGSTITEALTVVDFDDTTVEYMDWWVSLPATYAGGGLTLTITWAATSATTGAVVWSAAVRAFPLDAEDIDASHTYDYNDATATTTASASGEFVQSVITFTNGTDMDSWAAGEMAVLRIRRLPTDGGDTMTGDAELVCVAVKES